MCGMRKIVMVSFLVLAIGCAPEAIESDGAGEVAESAETAAASAEAVETSPDAEVPGAPAEGEAVPDFKLASHTGETVALSDAQGRPVVLAFYRGHW
jgi:cytochrome oxidase Cu insertion factor (SCO1/SenC/PrrC family)